MTETEDIILDQLYFVTPYKAIQEEVQLVDSKLQLELWELLNKGWIKCFSDPENEILVTESEFSKDFMKYHYLASKKGLLEHNKR